jgi:8-oxo-dGTP diphosphatase
MGKTRPQCGLLVENSEQQVLLQLRDDIPDIPWPGTWGTFGGQVEDGETPLEAIEREIREELSYNIPEPEYFGDFLFDGYDIYMYRLLIPGLTLDDVTVLEGQRAAFMSLAEVLGAECAANCKEIVVAYYGIFHGD